MVYGLPTRDELDWDVKLNASIEAVKDTADTAQATASAAETPAGAQAKADQAETDANTYTDTAVSTHSADTTSVHGIADTATLETQTGAQGKVDTHAVATAGVHGVTGDVVGTTDTQTLTNKTLTSPTLTDATVDNLTVTGGAWTAYTPTWTASTTNPSIGNGTMTGKYRKLGRTVHYQVEVVIGSTTTLGSGAWKIGLPTPAIDTLSVAHTGMVRFGGVLMIGRHADTTSCYFYDTSDGTALNATSYTFTAGDFVRVSGTYEAAA